MSKGRVVGVGVGLVLKGLVAALALLTPLLGVWGASSLAAYLNGPVWAAVLAGALLFPILPFGWDALGEWRRRRREARTKREGSRFLTLADRIILRTLSLNLVFIVALLAVAPARAFEALSTRGDWMLDGSDGPTASAVRSKLFWAAEKLEWLYVGSTSNPFEEMAEGGERLDPGLRPQPAPELPRIVPSDPEKNEEPTGDTTPSEDPAPKEGPPSKSWPLPDTLHPAVTRIPEDAERSIEGVARYLAAEEKDPFWLVKALHDYVADRIAYDAVSYAKKLYPPQDAQTVFKNRVGVCAGYANLLSALGKAAGVRIVWVGGDARTQGWELGGEGHAWNAVEIEGSWYLLDATWNAGSVDGTQFTKRYRTDYLFTPPRIFGLDHFPDEARWQLVDKPLSRGDFMRQPMVVPRFYELGFELVSPTRSQVTVSGSIDIEIDNPRGLFLLASFRPVDAHGEGTPCTVQDGARAKIACTLPDDGRFDVNLFANAEQYGSFAYVGRVGVNNDL